MVSSLYIHIPFCRSFCDYCDFFSVQAEDGSVLDAYIDVLLRDISEQLEFFGVTRVPTVYMGGGTPSALGAARMERLLAGLEAALAFRKAGGREFEFTVEANPESANDDFLRVCKAGGVNRISLGVQTFDGESRKAVHRSGGVCDANGACVASGGSFLEERLALAARCFPGAFSVDLIAGLPFQTEAVLLCDIERVLAYGPAHVSLYSLTVADGTPLAENIAARIAGAACITGAASAVCLPDRDTADGLWLAGRDALEKAGLAQYEVSNFAREGKQCAHNLRYWRMENWLGAGPAASGTLIDERHGTGLRRTYPADLDAYLSAGSPVLERAETEKLDRSALMRESLLMGFRRAAGPDDALFRRRFSVGIGETIPQTIGRWRGRGFFAASDTSPQARFAPSPNGLLFLDAFLRDAFAEMDNQ